MLFNNLARRIARLLVTFAVTAGLGNLAAPLMLPTAAYAQPSTPADNVQMSVSGTPGTGTITLNAATTDHQSFSAASIPNGSQISYFVQDAGSAWEIDQGTYNSSAGTLTRGLKESSTGSLLSLTSAAVVSVVWISADLNLLATLASPALTGSPTTPTQANGDTSTDIANDKFVSTCGNAPGERCLLATLTASNSANLQDTTHLTSAYIHYALVFNNIVPATTEKVCEILVYYNGSFQTSGYLALGTAGPSNGSSLAVTAATAYIPCALGNTTGNDPGNSSPGISGEIDITNPSSTSNPAQFSGTTTAIDGSGYFSTYEDCGIYDSDTYPVAGVEILMSSGNIESGTVYIYGWN